MDAIESPNFLEPLAARLHMPADLLAALLIFVLLLGAGRLLVKNWRQRPALAQGCLEVLWEWLASLSHTMIGKEGTRFLPFFITLFLFILTANLIGLLPGLKSPTTNLNINAGLALAVALTAQVLRIRTHGIAGYFRHFCGPPYWLAPLFILIRVIEELVRPLSLTMRLFGNIMAKEIILCILTYLITLFFFAGDIYSKILLPVPLVLRPLIILLGVLVSFIQAMVFTSLAMVYIGEALHKE